MSNVIVIVGAGFSGTVLAVNLLRRPRKVPTHVMLIERGSAMHRGLAYAERDIPYLLNVPAGRLSADSADVQQFLTFARESTPEAGPEDFLPRSRYGDYLEDLLKRAEREAAPNVSLERVHDEVVDLETAVVGTEVRFARRGSMRADKVVLAVGNPPASRLPWLDSLRGHEAVRENPWELPKHLEAHHAVMIVGNGLTMADVALTLSWDPARAPAMYTISRRGLLPQVQTSFQPSSACGKGENLLSETHSIRALLKASRKLAHRVEKAGGDWREAVTLIRNLAPQIWQRLPLQEQARFLRHLPPIADRLVQLKSSGKLRINAGRVQQVSAQGKRLRVEWLPRGERATRSLTVDLLVNATGPDYVLSRTGEPLLRSLQSKGLIAPDAHSLGIRTDGSGACLDTRGEPTANVYYLGPMLRADHWEATAATELRDHAERLSVRLTT
jgi:uncharacterized NAD(P)/FAD-binding protein YdhS